MSSHWWSRHHRARALGIGLLILSLAHAPLPQADFHNVRHHDGAGEVCELHDHLLRWHPDAGQAEDVALLHWHWFLPTTDSFEPGHAGKSPSLHAHLDRGEALTPDSGPLVVPDGASRPIAPPLPPLPGWLAWEAAIPPHPVDPADLRDPSRRVHAFSATFAPRVSLAAWLQHWSC